MGRLYFAAYEPGIAGADEREAIDDIRASFAGEYGALRLEWSRLALSAGTVVGVVLIVDRAPWPDTPDCPFIIELFTARNWRRHGVARALLAACISASGGQVALRVDQENSSARRLYESVGFAEV
jgi:GNAT superfamily N-acetyltransferase